MAKKKKEDLLTDLIVFKAKAGTMSKLEELAKKNRRELPSLLRLLVYDAIIKQTIV